MLSAGDPAPDFTLPDQHGSPVTLSELRGQPVVLYFYPRADTPGCTTQACGVRDHRAEYDRAGARVLGTSPDDVDAIAFIIDPQGRIAHVIEKASPKTHDAQVLDALSAIASARAAQV
jgi:peroxiredoxin Q/BCP